MAMQSLRHPDNVKGDFFVDTTCIDCDLCRQIAPQTFRDIGSTSVVFHQPDTPDQELQALKAWVTCPTGSIGTEEKHPRTKEAVASYPELIADGVYFCGFASPDSYGASSYLIVRPEGNVLIDSPRFAAPLVKQIKKMGGIPTFFLTHRDDVADHRQWAQTFDAQRVMHRDDAGVLRTEIEHLVSGSQTTQLDPELLVIPTPGHTRGHAVLLYRDKFLFSGDHVWGSERYQGLAASRGVCWYSWEEQIRSMERLQEFRFEWVLPGHGRRFHADHRKMQESLAACIARMKRQ